MSAAAVMASVGDHGVLNKELSHSVADVWLDRDLGWLDFNDRVLAEALDERTPLLERAKFLAIFTSNLDEFYMKRGGDLARPLEPRSRETAAASSVSASWTASHARRSASASNSYPSFRITESIC
ncbi:MAG: hypothetical protein WDO73_17640 [Ignavibacteriota bacterium]